MKKKTKGIEFSYLKFQLKFSILDKYINYRIQKVDKARFGEILHTRIYSIIRFDKNNNLGIIII